MAAVHLGLLPEHRAAVARHVHHQFALTLFGSRRYETSDTSKNNWLLALLTLGEGWHNNHHHFMASARQGFFWWEIDITYYTLKLCPGSHRLGSPQSPRAFAYSRPTRGIAQDLRNHLGQTGMSVPLFFTFKDFFQLGSCTYNERHAHD